MKPETDEEEEDDILFEEYDIQFRLVALILASNRPKLSWPDVVKWFENDMMWKKIFADKHPKIEDAKMLWDGIKDDCGEQAAIVLIPLLDQAEDSGGNAGKLQQALKKV